MSSHSRRWALCAVTTSLAQGNRVSSCKSGQLAVVGFQEHARLRKRLPSTPSTSSTNSRSWAFVKSSNGRPNGPSRCFIPATLERAPHELEQDGPVWSRRDDLQDDMRAHTREQLCASLRRQVRALAQLASANGLAGVRTRCCSPANSMTKAAPRWTLHVAHGQREEGTSSPHSSWSMRCSKATGQHRR